MKDVRLVWTLNPVQSDCQVQSEHQHSDTLVLFGSVCVTEQLRLHLLLSIVS